MGKTHLEQLELAKQLKDAASVIEVGARYWHYKSHDKVYKVIGLGFLEATDELCVIYQAQYDEGLTFIRPLSVWLESVDWESKIVPRFTKLKN